MFTAVLFVTAKNWKAQMSVDICDLINKIEHMCTMQHSPGIRNKKLIHKIDLKSTMLSERRLAQKTTYCTIPFT